ncbi:MAG: hypothetical protein ACI83D_000044 [Planctomycetota bacterium]|jgi:hypothetical protein
MDYLMIGRMLEVSIDWGKRDKITYEAYTN